VYINIRKYRSRARVRQSCTSIEISRF